MTRFVDPGCIPGWRRDRRSRDNPANFVVVKCSGAMNGARAFFSTPFVIMAAPVAGVGKTFSPPPRRVVAREYSFHIWTGGFHGPA
jgi:hypothetical protein